MCDVRKEYELICVKAVDVFVVMCVKAYYLLGKGGYDFGGVCLFVCLSVDNITQKVMNRLG